MLDSFCKGFVFHTSKEPLANDLCFNVVLLQTVLEILSYSIPLQLVHGRQRATASMKVDKGSWTVALAKSTSDSLYTYLGSVGLQLNPELVSLD